MQLDDYRARWNQKHALRAVYQDLYQRMARVSVVGLSLEIGGGIGNLEIPGKDLIRVDIQGSSGVHLAADAHFLPFRDGVISNVYMFDVLHHLQCPLLFIAEAQRVLRPGGRLIMIEPGISPWSHLIYGLGHEEPVDMHWNPRVPCKPNPSKDPYESNQAIPTLLFTKYREVLTESGISLSVSECRWLSLFAYPMSGGFKQWSLIPSWLVTPVLKFEDWLLPYLGRIMAFRLMIVLEKV